MSKKKIKVSKVEVKPKPLNAVKMMVHTRKMESGHFQYSFVGILVSDRPLDNIAVDDHGSTMLESIDDIGDVSMLHGTMCLLRTRPANIQGLSFDQAALSLRDL